MASKALILVDFEKEWVDLSSEYYVGDIGDVVKKTNKIIDFCRRRDYKIIFTKHIEKDSTFAFAQDSKNVEIIDELHKEKSDTLISKYKISPFFKTNLEQELQGVKEIVVCGILTNLCVRSLVQDAYDRGFDITLLKDCCVAFDDATQEFTFKDLKATMPEIKLANIDEFILL